MKNAKILICILGALLIFVSTGCKKDDADPKANIEADLVGYWFKLSSSYSLINDLDGYLWGVKIEKDGQVTIARWDYSAGVIETEADGAVFKFSKAQDGSFTGLSGEDEISGTYNLSTVVLSERTYANLYFYSSMLIGEYLPGGYSGDWSVNGNYARTHNLDGSDAEI